MFERVILVKALLVQLRIPDVAPSICVLLAYTRVR